MRELADERRIRAFMRALGDEAREPGRVYFTGGASAVLSGWRASTIDVDLLFAPEQDRLFRELPRLKESLKINVELASPAHFIPELPGWDTRSPFIEMDGKIAFHHYDFYAQALAKIERGHHLDAADVEKMIRSGFVEPPELLRLFEEIEPRLYRYPAIDPGKFRAAVEKVVIGWKAGGA